MDIPFKIPPDYEIEREIARTTTAIVYAAIHQSSGNRVAMKLVQRDCSHEVEMLKRVMDAHGGAPRHVVHILGAYEDGPNLWLILEYFDETLNSLEPSQMTPMALMSIALDSARGLAEMERAGIVDDDIKPGNMAFKVSGRVAHIDLGAARLPGEQPHGSTPEFSAPEVFEGMPSDTSSVFGWARTVEWLVTGLTGQGPDYRLDDIMPWVGRDFASLVVRCTQGNPALRPSPLELADEVTRIVGERRRCHRCRAIVFGEGGCKWCGWRRESI